MTLLEKLSWTSRAESCEALIDFLATTIPTRHPRARDEKPWRSTVADLLSILATPREERALRRLLLDRREEVWVRTYALRALVRLEARLPTEELEGLLSEEVAHERATAWRSWDDPWQCRHPSLEELLGLARGEDQLMLAVRLVAALPARAKTLLLVALERSVHHVPPVIVRALYRQWLLHDRQLLADPAELDVACLTCEQHAESRAIVLERWPELSPEQQDRALFRLTLTGEGRQLLEPGSKPWRDAADALSLPIADLVDAFGEDGLGEHFARELRRALDDGSRVKRAWACVGIIVRRLGAWPQAARRTLALLEDRAIHPLARRGLAEALFSQDRSRAREWALERLEKCEELDLVLAVIEKAATAPIPEDATLLRHAVECREVARIRYLAFEALEAIGGETLSSDDLRERLGDPDGFVRLRTLAALARRGDAASETRLVRAAKADPDVRLRAEAMSWLAELDARGHVDIFEHALFHDHETWLDGWSAPAAEEAALGLARDGTPESFTTLLRAYLVAPTDTVAGAIEHYLGVHLAREGGRDAPLRPHGLMWRGTRPRDPFWRGGGR